MKKKIQSLKNKISHKISNKKHIYIGIAALIAASIIGVFIYLYSASPTPEVGIENHEEVATSTEVIVPKTYTFIEIISSCNFKYEGVCAKAYAKPNASSTVRAQLRNGIVLGVDSKVTDVEGKTWYKIKFEKLVHPDRVKGDWYISEESASEFEDAGEEIIPAGTKLATSTQRIVVDLSEQILRAYEDGELAMEMIVSTGAGKNPTPLGSYRIFKKMPSRYMQAPQAGNLDYYDIPGVPWDMYFDHRGNVIHGAYWHNNFGRTYSHGCVNLAPSDARTLYMWAKLGTKVIIQK